LQVRALYQPPAALSFLGVAFGEAEEPLALDIYVFAGALCMCCQLKMKATAIRFAQLLNSTCAVESVARALPAAQPPRSRLGGQLYSGAPLGQGTAGIAGMYEANIRTTRRSTVTVPGPGPVPCAARRYAGSSHQRGAFPTGPPAYTGRRQAAEFENGTNGTEIFGRAQPRDEKLGHGPRLGRPDQGGAWWVLACLCGGGPATHGHRKNTGQKPLVCLWVVNKRSS
jgi:hypothetical protein